MDRLGETSPAETCERLAMGHMGSTVTGRFGRRDRSSFLLHTLQAPLRCWEAQPSGSASLFSDCTARPSQLHPTAAKIMMTVMMEVGEEE